MVFEFEKEEACCFRLPSAGLSKLVVWDRFVLMIDRHARNPSLIWDALSRSLREFRQDLQKGFVYGNGNLVKQVGFSQNIDGTVRLDFEEYTLTGLPYSHQSIVMGSPGDIRPLQEQNTLARTDLFIPQTVPCPNDFEAIAHTLLNAIDCGQVTASKCFHDGILSMWPSCTNQFYHQAHGII